MKILYVCYEYPPFGGGGGVWVKNLAEELAKKNEVWVVTGGESKKNIKKKEGGVFVVRIAGLKRISKGEAGTKMIVSFLMNGFMVLWKMRGEKFDVIHSVFATPSGILGVFFARLGKIAHVTTFVGGEVFDPSKKLNASSNFFVRNVVRLVGRSADTVTVISKDMRLKTEKNVGLRATVLPIGVKLRRYKEIKKNKRFTMICVARLVERKNLDLLIRTLAHVPDVILEIIGEGPVRKKLEILSKEIGVSDRVIFLGHVSESEKWIRLRRAHVFALVSKHEGFGLVYVEAMSVGLPIIAGNVGGQLDFIKNNKNGYLVKSDDVFGLVLAIDKLKVESERQRIGEYNKGTARNYDIGVIGRIYKSLYEKNREKKIITE